jgi:hypothetical protein
MKTVVYIEITCPIHQEVRMGLAEFPDSKFTICPCCPKERDLTDSRLQWVILGGGMTAQELPIVERLNDLWNWKRFHPCLTSEEKRRREVRSRYQHSEARA